MELLVLIIFILVFALEAVDFIKENTLSVLIIAGTIAAILLIIKLLPAIGAMTDRKSADRRILLEKVSKLEKEIAELQKENAELTEKLQRLDGRNPKK